MQAERPHTTVVYTADELVGRLHGAPKPPNTLHVAVPPTNPAAQTSRPHTTVYQSLNGGNAAVNPVVDPVLIPTLVKEVPVFSPVDVPMPPLSIDLAFQDEIIPARVDAGTGNRSGNEYESAEMMGDELGPVTSFGIEMQRLGEHPTIEESLKLSNRAATQRKEDEKRVNMKKSIHSSSLMTDISTVAYPVLENMTLPSISLGSTVHSRRTVYRGPLQTAVLNQPMAREYAAGVIYDPMAVTMDSVLPIRPPSPRTYPNADPVPPPQPIPPEAAYPKNSSYPPGKPIPHYPLLNLQDQKDHAFPADLKESAYPMDEKDTGTVPNTAEEYLLVQPPPPSLPVSMSPIQVPPTEAVPPPTTVPDPYPTPGNVVDMLSLTLYPDPLYHV